MKALFKDLKDCNRASADFSQLLTQDSLSSAMCPQPCFVDDSTPKCLHLSGCAVFRVLDCAVELS